MLRLLAILSLFLVSSFAMGQAVISLDVNTKDEDTGKKLGGVKVEVYKNGQLFTTKSSASNGKVPIIDLPVEEGATYQVFLKKPGYVTKMAEIDAHSDYPDELPPVIAFPFQTSLFATADGVDFTFLETSPMIKMYIGDGGYQDWDKDHLEEMKKKIANLKKEINEKKEEEEQKKADFDAYVKAGDNAVKKEDYQKAIEQYDLALDLIDDVEVQTKRNDAQDKLDAQNASAELDAKFNEKMAAGKSAWDADDLEGAIALYKEAKDLKPAESLPQQYITEIQAELDKRKANEENFNNLVAQGDAEVSAENYDVGISKYEEALKIKSDATVQKKLDDAKKAKADKEAADQEAAELEANYNKAIDAADKAFDTEDYETAKTKYNEALGFKPGEAHPTGRLSEIDRILKERADELAAKEKLDADYQKLLDEAKELFDTRDWEAAKSKYQAAHDLKPEENFPLDQINLINKEIANAEASAALDEKYNTLMSEAKSFFDQKQYDEAISKYEEASGIKPEEQEPKDEINKIRTLMADEEKAAQIEADYKKFMDEGKALRGNSDWTAAITSFEKALEVKPGDADAQKEIDEINAIVAEEQEAAAKEAEFNELVKKGDEKLNAKDYTSAKMNYQKALEIKADQAIEDKIKEIDELIAAENSEAELQAKYDAKMSEANSLYTSNDYKAALEKYEEASSIKPDEQEPKDKILELKEKIEDDEKAAAEEEQFNNLVTEADNAYAAKDYDLALAQYKEALTVRSDIGVSTKIGEINALIAEIDQNLEKDELYAKKMEEADAAFDRKDWDVAKEMYNSALEIKPSEQRPKDQIAQIDANIAAEAEAAADKDYQEIIEKADQLFDEDNLDDAIIYYNRAINTRPNDQYPKDQIDKINQIKQDRASADAEIANAEKAYQDLIKKGDEAFNAKNYDLALATFKEALEKRPNDPYPQQKIDEINLRIADQDSANQLEADYKAKIDEADALFNSGEYQASIPFYREAIAIKSSDPYPMNQIGKAEEFMKQQTLTEAEAQYQKIISKAEEKFADKNYTGAISLYERAKTIKPDDPIPQQRIDEINQIINREAEDEKNQADYDEFIRKADNDFEAKKWKEAKVNYQNALGIFDEQYPKDQIKIINQNMRSETSAELEAQYQKIITKADEYFYAENWEKAKNLYQRALSLKSYDQYPKDQIAKIDTILYPKEEVSSGYYLKDYGEPNRNTNVIDVDALLDDGNDEERFNISEDVVDVREEYEDNISNNTLDQIDETYDAKDGITDLQEEQRVEFYNADLERVEYEEDVVEIGDNLADRDRAWSMMNDNDVQHTKTSVTNLENDIAKQRLDDDEPRSEYIADVEAIELNLITYDGIHENAQNVEIYDTREFVEEYLEDNVNTDPNMDIDRKNNEVYVEDLNVSLINKKNKDAWNQEDEILEVKEQTEILTDEQIARNIGADNQRIEGVEDVNDLNVELYSYEKNLSTSQYDETIETKNYTEDLVTEIEHEKIGNDQPRLDTEVEVVELTAELDETTDHNVTDQNNVLFESDAKIDDFEIEMQDNLNEWDKPRKEYEEDVVDMNDEIIETDNEMYNKGINATNNTEDLVHNLEEDQHDFLVLADEKQNDVIENTTKAVDNIIQSNAENLAKNENQMEETEDYLDDLKYDEVGMPKEKGTNKLGDDFPEGVTEEIFTFENEDGQVTSYVIRRIVVVNGWGIVYEKTKKKYGVATYTKNGNGITETQWQDETESAELVRN